MQNEKAKANSKFILKNRNDGIRLKKKRKKKEKDNSRCEVAIFLKKPFEEKRGIFDQYDNQRKLKY